MKRLYPVFILLLLASCVAPRRQDAPAIAPPSAGWLQYSSAGEAGFEAAALEETRARANDAGSAAVMAVVDGRVIAAWGDVERKLELHSVRKSLYSALWGIAVERGLVRLEATLGEMGIDDLQPLTAEEKRATLADLLSARSGVYHPAAYAAADDRASRPARGSHPHGTFWYYNNWDFNVAGAVLERVTGKPLGVLFDEWIARPVGMEDYGPGDVFAVLEPHTSRWPALTFRMSARDLARFGQLWLDRGRCSGRQIISEAWIDRASKAASETGEPGHGYAMMWWTYDRGSLGAERYPAANRQAILQARGTGGQALFIIPDAKMVIVHRGDTDHGKSVPGREIWAVVDRILGARTGQLRAAFRTTALRAEPFSNPLPPMDWPRPVALEPAALEKLTGSYELAPGVTARVFLHEGRLFASMPGQGEAELFARSPSDFYIRVDPTVTIRFEVDESGRASSLVATLRGRTMTGRRVTG